jgi:hypothetical protein
MLLHYNNSFTISYIIYDSIVKSVPYWVKHLNATKAEVASKITKDTAKNAV